MIKFSDIARNLDIKKPEEQQDTRSNVAVEKAKGFWDNMFAKEIETEETMEEISLSEIFGRSFEEFSFEFEISEEMESCLAEFSEEKWMHKTEREKETAVKELVALVSDSLGLEEKPDILFVAKDAGSCGAFHADMNTIEVNTFYFDEPKELVDTIAHESRHAYQQQRATIGETYMDRCYQCNLENYISPIPLGDGKYLLFTDYQDQLVEAEAAAYANAFVNLGVM